MTKREEMNHIASESERFFLRKLARPEKRKPRAALHCVTEKPNTTPTIIEHITDNSPLALLPWERYDIRRIILRGLRLVVILAGLFFVIVDVSTFQLSSSNGRFVSFLDSFENCFAFRAQQPFQPVDDSRQPLSPRKRRQPYHIGNPVRSIKWKLRALVLSFLCKYASSTIVSLLLWTTPVFLKGPRHLIYFTLALILIQFFPGDVPFRTVKTSLWTQLMIATGTSFYKARKLFFVLSLNFFCFNVVNRLCNLLVHVFDGNFSLSAWLSVIVLSVVTVDGNAMARTLENLLTHRGVRTNNPKAFASELSLGISYFWHRNIGLFLSATSVFITNSACNRLSQTELGTVACNIHFISKLGALLVFMERKNIWRANVGQSLLWRIAQNTREREAIKVKVP